MSPCTCTGRQITVERKYQILPVRARAVRVCVRVPLILVPPAGGGQKTKQAPGGIFHDLADILISETFLIKIQFPKTSFPFFTSCVMLRWRAHLRNSFLAGTGPNFPKVFRLRRIFPPEGHFKNSATRLATPCHRGTGGRER